MDRTEKDPERPPVVSTWRRLYVIVLLNLALQILLFFLLTKAFR
jgi:hypothetical protein